MLRLTKHGLRTALAAALLLTSIGLPTLVDATSGPVDINAASASELAELPGIGMAKAQAIVDHRKATPFESIDDLARVKGIGPKMLERLRPSVTVGAQAATN